MPLNENQKKPGQTVHTLQIATFWDTRTFGKQPFAAQNN